MDTTLTIGKWIICAITVALIADITLPLICDIVADLTDYIKETRRRVKK